MRPFVSLLFLAFLLSIPQPTEGAEPDILLEQFVHQAVEGPAIGDPGPTSLIGDLLRTDPAQLREVLGRHWEERHLYAWDSARALEEVTHLLFGLTPDGRDPGTRPPGCGLWEFREAVLVRKVYDGARWDGPFLGEDLPSFEVHFGDRKLRAPPAPDPAALWAGFEAGAADDWGEAERISFALTLGAAARADPLMAKKLLAAARAEPRSRLLTVALGELGGPEVTTLLVDRFRAAAPKANDRPPRFLEIVRCLARVDPDGLRNALSGVDPSRRPWVTSLISCECLIPALLRDLEAAEGDAARRTALAALNEIVRGESYGSRSWRGLPRYLRILVRELDRTEGEDRETLLAAAKQLLGVVESFPISGSFATPEGSTREQGRWFGPIGGVEHLLESLVEDLDAGRLLALKRRPDRFKPVLTLSPPPSPVKADGSRAQTDLPCPIPSMSEPDARFPVHAAMGRVDGGVRLILTNVGPEAFLVSPEALRYGSMTVSRVTTHRAAKGGETHRQLKLEFGRLWGPFAVPAAGLARVEPGGTFSWVVPVPPDIGEITMVVLSLDRYPIVGRVESPVLFNINETWLR
jgi:hypothetical protein